MGRYYGILLFLSTLLINNVSAQNAFSVQAKKQPLITPVHLQVKPTFIVPGIYPSQPLQPVAVNFYSQHLPFFCRQELKMEQAHIPLKIRVGNIDDCNRLERKPGYIYNP